MFKPDIALIIVDMQKYYLSKNSSYYKYFNHLHPGCLEYIINRCQDTVTPNIKNLIDLFHDQNRTVIYLRLCGEKIDRSDLHRFFKDTYKIGKSAGFDNIYPLESDPSSEVIDELKPSPGSIIIKKTTYSAFTSTDINKTLNNNNISSIVFTGLATSQCVETTARDASDHGFEVIHISDAQADYDETSHNTSLFTSQMVCGGIFYKTDELIDYLKNSHNNMEDI